VAAFLFVLSDIKLSIIHLTLGSFFCIIKVSRTPDFDQVIKRNLGIPDFNHVVTLKKHENAKIPNPLKTRHFDMHL